MNNEEISKMENEDLVKLAGGTVIGTPSGLKAQHAQAELTKRLLESIGELNKNIKELNTTSSEYSEKLIRLTKIIISLTLVLGLLAGIQIYLLIR